MTAKKGEALDDGIEPQDFESGEWDSSRVWGRPLSSGPCINAKWVSCMGNRMTSAFLARVKEEFPVARRS